MPRPIALYNTLTRKVDPLVPLEEGKLRVYTCGPTVYDAPHLGNYRYFLFEDTLVRALRHFGYQVRWVMNVTDVGHLVSDEDEGEDKLEVGARREGSTAWEVARKYEQAFLEESAELHMQRPDALVRATETIAEQISLVSQLEEKGYTYRLEDGIYFDSQKFPEYGRLARLDVKGLQAGARVAVQEGKRQPTDFALWKFSPPGAKRDMEWPSPWGVGFPGWHLECSAIAMDQLGAQLDIHCGGIDHIPVHHTNEIAQSEAVTGLSFARHWLHCAFLTVDGGKMGKSLGNAYTLRDIKEHGFEPLAFRLFTYSASYRATLNFTWEALRSSQTSLARLRTLLAEARQAEELRSDRVGEYLERFDEALADDLNLPAALAVAWEVARAELPAGEKRAFFAATEPVLALGLLEEPPAEQEEVPAPVRELAAERQRAREAKDWALADQLRLQIEEAGYQVSDGSQPGLTRRQPPSA